METVAPKRKVSLSGWGSPPKAFASPLWRVKKTRAIKRSPAAAQTAVAVLASQANAQAVMNEVARGLNGREFNLALLGGQKYMVNNCLGLKASAGEFYMRVASPNLRIEGGSIVLTFRVPRISMTGLKVRMRPNLGNPANPCHFSGRFEVGGSASDVRLEYRFSPVINLKECRTGGVNQLTATWHIGGLNLKPLQNNLDDAARLMVTDSLKLFLVRTFADFLDEQVNRAVGMHLPNCFQ